MKEINFVTGNRNKLSEVQTILKDTVTVQGLAVDIPEIQGTVEEIAREKCRRAAEKVKSLICCNSLALFDNIESEHWIDRRSGSDRGYGTPIPGIEGSSWAIHVSGNQSTSSLSLPISSTDGKGGFLKKMVPRSSRPRWSE